MRALFSKEVLFHPLVLASCGIALLIAVVGGAYYFISTRPPQEATIIPAMGNIEEVVTGTGTVTPAQNPNLAFQSGGRVAAVNVSVGQQVAQGQILASLDLSSLNAQEAQAQANVGAAEATLQGMLVPPQPVDVEAKETAVSQASTTLGNLYATVPTNVAAAYDQSFSGVSSDSDTLFNDPDSPSPVLVFSTVNPQLAVNAQAERAQVNNELAGWSGEANSLSPYDSSTQMDTALVDALNHLGVIRDYCDALLLALGNAAPSSTFGATDVSSAQTNVGTLRNTVNGLIATLQTLQQNLASDALGVQAAQDALNQLLASSTPQAIAAQQASVEAAQAAVEGDEAQITNAEIVAPFSGVVSSVEVKPGDTVSAGTVGIALVPQSALQVDVYLSDVDASEIALGDQAQVTLDAYGPSRVFPATVVSIDTSPTTPPDNPNATPAYKTTLQFAQNNPSITNGMGANATIVGAQQSNVLIIPSDALIQNGDQYFVLLKQGNSAVERPVGVGIMSTSTVQITSGLSPTDELVVSAP